MIVSICLIACNNAIPNKYWKDYRSKQIVNTVKQQGPWGNWSHIIWKTTNENPFQADNIISFAAQNNWTFIDSTWIYANTYNELTTAEYKAKTNSEAFLHS